MKQPDGVRIEEYGRSDTISAVCFGVCRNSQGNLPTDKLFTGQRLDGTGLYYYNARYYDPTIGRFISADSVVPDEANPQSLNRYSYVLNNPLRYNDPSGHGGPNGKVMFVSDGGGGGAPSWGGPLDVLLTMAAQRLSAFIADEVASSVEQGNSVYYTINYNDPMYLR